MLISYTRNFLFVHLLRTGGTSITRALKTESSSPEQYLENRILRALGIRVNHFTTYQRKLYRTHTSARSLRKNMPPEIWDSLFKFTVVRNPFDRIVSLYTHLTGRRDGRLIGRRYGSDMENMTFGEFISAIHRFPFLHQKQQITDDTGKLLVNHVAHFESLKEDFLQILRIVNVETTLDHLNGSRHRNYREYYTPSLIQSVSEYFAEDLEFFGYDFETGLATGLSESQQLSEMAAGETSATTEHDGTDRQAA
ncbi:MAG: sulfotransferase family protein [Fuerstiella sp.]|nr:sulfotransferase family protein [Fuerstiella sp.]